MANSGFLNGSRSKQPVSVRDLKMTNVQNDLRTRRVASWSQTQEGGMFDEKAHRKEEDEKSQVETWSQAQMFGVADAKTRRKKEDKKSQVETWSQTHAVGVDDEIPQCRKGPKMCGWSLRMRRKRSM